MNRSKISRRQLLCGLGASALSVAPLLRGLAEEAKRKEVAPPKRFVFIVRSNGILPTEIQPRELSGLVRVRANGGWQKTYREEPLARLTLSEGLEALEPFKSRLTILQGLSGKMCSASHNAGFGALGAYKSKGETPPTAVTIDGALARGLDGPFRHLGFAMEQHGPQIVYPPLSAAGPRKPLPYFADPLVAFGELFGGISSDAKLQASVEADRKLLDFVANDVRRFRRGLPAAEKEKIDHYLEGFESLEARTKRLAGMERQIREAAPKLREVYRSEIETERLDAHFELATSALIGGLTRVVSIRAEHLGMRLTGLGLGSRTVHHIGHMIEGKAGNSAGGGQDFADGKGEFATRAVIMKYHMKNIAAMARRLATVREGNGTMLDNTVIVYLSDHGDRHHSKFFEWPMIALGNVGDAFRTGRYIHVPGYGSTGHRTIAQLYLSLLQGAGLPQETFGQADLALPPSIQQKGPITEWMT